MIGTVLNNRYKIIGELGSGGMAWVYLAEDLAEDQLVAVKILYPQYSQDAKFLQRFGQESELAMSLSTCAPVRQIVCVLDYGSDEDTHYLVMEYVQGQDLGQIITERGPLPWQETLGLARQIAMALDHADQYEIVHRDIKPGNIMVVPEGAVRVLDFGIARARTSPHLTLSGFVGSPHYTAPEQAMGERVDIRADIYSLGVVIYHMLSGHLPFQGNTPWAIVNQHIAEPPPPLEQIRPGLPAPVIDLVGRALAKSPEDRFQTPPQIIDAIDKVVAGQELPAIPVYSVVANSTEAAAELYQRGKQALEAEGWHLAINLFSKALKLDPAHPGVARQLAYASRQIRLATQYRAARRALVLGKWDEASSQLEQIAETDPDYLDIGELQAKAAGRERLDAGAQGPGIDLPTLVNSATSSETTD